MQRVQSQGSVDLEGLEFYVRAALLKAGAAVLEHLLEDVGQGRRSEPLVCACGHLPTPMHSTGVQTKQLETILGPVRFARSRFVCPCCAKVRYPGDETLDIIKTGFSPGLRRLMTRAGSRESFAQAAEDLQVYGAIHVDAKDVERVAEATGREIDAWMRRQASEAVLHAGGAPEPQRPSPATFYVTLDGGAAPMRTSELQGRRGKGESGKPRSREVKLGAVFTQTTRDEAGHPQRDPASTSYVGAIEESCDFGPRLYAEAVRRGLLQARRVIVLCDGAEYNRSIVQAHFPQATPILDFFHAAKHLADFIRDDVGKQLKGTLHQDCHALLEAGEVELLLERMRQALPHHGPRRKSGLTNIDYFAQRAGQMRYADFRNEGLFIGSGVIEAGCKTLIGRRLKQSGMFWTVKGANAILAARCCLYSGRFEQFWEDRAA